MKHFKRIRKLPMVVYNFFNMFHKDKGAHFTYNMGVSMMRMGLLFFIAAVAVTVLFILSDSPSIRVRDNIMAYVTDCREEKQSGVTVGVVSFYVEDSEGRVSQVTQNCAASNLAYYQEQLTFGNRCQYTRYRIAGRDDYISYHRPFTVRSEYFWAYPDVAKPVPVWTAGVAFLLMLMFFYIGSREIRVSMKYPRNDVPEELSGAPVVFSGGISPEMQYDDIEEENYDDQLPQERLQ